MRTAPLIQWCFGYWTDDFGRGFGAWFGMYRRVVVDPRQPIPYQNMCNVCLQILQYHVHVTLYRWTVRPTFVGRWHVYFGDLCCYASLLPKLSLKWGAVIYWQRNVRVHLHGRSHRYLIYYFHEITKKSKINLRIQFPCPRIPYNAVHQSEGKWSASLYIPSSCFLSEFLECSIHNYTTYTWINKTSSNCLESYCGEDR